MHDLLPNEPTMLAMLGSLAERSFSEARGMPPAPSGDDDYEGAQRIPGARIPLRRGLALWNALPGATGCPTVGLRLGRRAPFASFHYLGAAVASAPHLFSALQVYCQYFPYLCTREYLFERVAGDTLTIGWDDPSGEAPDCLRDFVFAQIVDILAQFGVQPSRPIATELTGRPPEGWEEYIERFHCPVTFGHHQSRMRLRTNDLAIPTWGANAALHTTIIHRLGAFDRTAHSVVGRVVGALEHLLDQGDARIESVARALGMRPRSLQEQLRRNGYRFSELLEQIRQRRAINLLCETDAPVSRIAASLGYGGSGTFARAFQDWFGETPASFRERARKK